MDGVIYFIGVEVTAVVVTVGDIFLVKRRIAVIIIEIRAVLSKVLGNVSG